jgi:hypothetical protein
MTYGLTVITKTPKATENEPTVGGQDEPALGERWGHAVSRTPPALRDRPSDE